MRAKNFEEVCLGYDAGEAMEEGIPVLKLQEREMHPGVPGVHRHPGIYPAGEGREVAEAAAVIGKSSALPAVCGRVCPQESQCEGNACEGSRGRPVSIGKLERLWRTGPVRMGSNRRRQRRPTAKRWR